MSQVIVECLIWKAILADDRLAGARRKLSFHEIRLIVDHALAAAASGENSRSEVEGEAPQSGPNASEGNAQ